MKSHIIKIQKGSGILPYNGRHDYNWKLQSLGFFILKYLPFLGKLAKIK